MFAHGHFCSNLVLSIYTGKSWPKSFKVPKVRVRINFSFFFSEFLKALVLNSELYWCTITFESKRKWRGDIFLEGPEF